MSDEQKMSEEVEQTVEEKVEGLEVEPTAEERPAEITPELTDEQKVAVQALEDAGAPVSEEGKVSTVPLSVAAELRADRRELREVNQRLTEAIEKMVVERQQAVQPEVKISPLESWIVKRREEGYDPDEETAPASVLLAHDRWKDEQISSHQEALQAQSRSQTGNQSVKRAEQTYSDFKEVVELGKQYLTEGNRVDIFKSEDPGPLLYKLCVRAAIESRTGDAKIMRQMLQSKLSTKTKTTVPTQKKEEAEVKNEEVGTPAPLNKQLAHIMRALGV